LQQHQVRGVSMPVRAEFVREKPLKADDLKAIDIRVYHRKPGFFNYFEFKQKPQFLSVLLTKIEHVK
jgi:hypothetical protein